MYQVAVCDDDREFARSFAQSCEKLLQEAKQPYQLRLFFSAEDLLQAFVHHAQIDLLFLDIRLGERNGIDLAAALQDRGAETSVVLMSSDSAFLLQGYSVQPLYFLLKPIDPQELKKAFALDRKRRDKGERIAVKCGQSTVWLPVGDIFYLEVLNHDLTLHTRQGAYVTRSTLTEVLRMLPETRFCRCHNSYAVNLQCVSSFSRTTGVALDCGAQLPIGRKYYNDFQQRLIEFVDRF